MEGRKKQLFTIPKNFPKNFSLKKLKKDQILILLLAGILLLVISLPVDKKETVRDERTGIKRSAEDTGYDQDAYLYSLEQRLEQTLSQMAGVGDVTVMVTLKSSAEKVVEKDLEAAKEAVTESDSQGGARSTQNDSRAETTVYADGGAQGEPYVSKELCPQIEGVVVIAGGGEDSVVKQNITEAVQALFGIDTHKIRIMKKSS